MKKNKFALFLYFIILVSIIIMTFGIITIYYQKTIKKEPEIIKREYVLLTSFENGNQIKIDKIDSTLNNEYIFSIENTSELIGKYKIVIDVIDPLTNLVDEDFIYSLSSTTSKKDSDNSLIAKNDMIVPSYKKEIGTGIITPKTKHNYVLNIKYRKNNKRKEYFLNKNFIANIIIEKVD